MSRVLFLLLSSIVFGIGFTCGRLTRRDEMRKSIVQLEKVCWYYQLLNMWLEMRQNGKSITTYLQKKGIKQIAIYGMKELGERLYEELRNTEIEVICIIDKTPDLVLGDFQVISPEEKIPNVDAIIVTADYYYHEISEQIKTKVNCPVYSLNGVLGNSFGRYL